MKKIFLAIIALLSITSMAVAQNNLNGTSDEYNPIHQEMSPEMKAYVNHLMGLDKPQSSASKAPRKVSASSWSYPTSTPTTPFGGGTGTEANPYLISTPQQLVNLAYMVNNGTTYSGYYFKMTDDIILNSNVLASDGSLNSGTFQSWTPIGSSSNYFKGTFDGDGHYVSGVYINDSSVNYKGLFGRSSNGLITKLGLIDSYIYGNNYVGGILGHSDYASVTYCYNKATVIGSFDVGGIIGDVCGSGGSSCTTSGSEITACSNYGAITETGSHCVGGITGYAPSATTISYCINYGTISSTSGDKAAGIYGEGSSPTCSNCANIGSIIISASASSSSYGAISYDGSPSNCYYLEGSCTQAGGGTSKTAAEFANGTVLSLIDPSGTYFKQGANGYPVLTGVGEGATASSAYLYMDTNKMVANTATTVNVNMKNDAIITGFQFDLVLPSGVTLNSVTKVSSRNSYTLSISQKTQADGSIRIVCIPTGSAAARFTGTDGAVLQLSLTSTSTGDKTITLKNQVLTTSSLSEITGSTQTATLHVHSLTSYSTAAATCTTTGHSAYYYCSLCGKYYTTSAATTETTLAAVTTPALGHDYGEAVFTWAANGKSATATRTCSRNSSHTLSGSATITSKVKTAATCTTKGTTTYTATITLDGTTYTDTKDVEDIAALGHSYGTPTWTWAEDGKSASAEITCTRNSSHTLSGDATITSAVKTAATCTVMGTTTYTATVTIDGTTYTSTKDVQDIPVLGHSYGTPTWTWSADGKSASATIVCTHDASHTLTGTATITNEIKTAATCTVKGTTTYTAKVTLNGTEYTSTKDVQDIPALGHSYNAPVWAWVEDGSAANATFTCSSNDDTQTVSATITNAVKADATCTVKGTTTYSATVTFNGTEYTATKDIQNIDVLGHNTTAVDNGNGTHTITCSRCDYTLTENHTFAEGACSACGAIESIGDDPAESTTAVYADDVTAFAGNPATLPIELKSTFNVKSVQFDVILPEGMTFDGTDSYTYTTTDRIPSKYVVTCSTEKGKTTNTARVMVVCYSDANALLTGNSGIILNVPVNVPLDFAKGEYPIYITGVTMANEEGEEFDEVESKMFKSTLTIPDYLMGDANCNGKVNVVDITSIVSYIYGNNPSPFNDVAADVNGNGKINVVDITGIVNIIYGGSSSAKGKVDYATPSLNLNDVKVINANEIVLPVKINQTSGSVNGLQFDMTLPNDVIASDITLAYGSVDRMKCRGEYADGKYRVLIYSEDGTSFANTAIVDISLKIGSCALNTDSNILVDNLVFSIDGREYDAPDMTINLLGATTGIENVYYSSKDCKVYDAAGHIMNKVRKGVNIIRKNDGTIKKVLK